MSEKVEETSSSSKLFYENISQFIDSEDITSMKSRQYETLKNFQESNAKLNNHLIISEQKYEEIYTKYTKHQKLLQNMKTDLEFITKKLREIKSKTKVE
eukprot:gene2466-3176_t